MNILAVRFVSLFFIMLSISGCIDKEVPDNMIPDVPDKNEIVMHKGMKITAFTTEGPISITAGKGLKRSYTWEGETRSVVMWPRGARWFGSMGIYYPGPGNHWKEHNGITRGVVEEGQQHFDTLEEAIVWSKRRCRVFRNDGLCVYYSKYRNRMNVNVWQMYIGGKTISNYQESAKIKDNDPYYTDPSYNRMKKICLVGGEKPISLPGAQDDKIKVEFLP